MKYPTAKRQPVAVTFGRVSYTDDFQWLEQDSPESLEFQALQDGLTRAWFNSNPAGVRAQALMDSMPHIENDFPLFSGGRWFRKRTPEGRKMHVVEVADSSEGPWRLVVDLQDFANGRMLSVDNFVPSPDGRKAVIGFSVDGVELAELRVFEVDSGKVLMDSIPQVYAFFAAWLPDSSGFYILGRDPGAMQDGSWIYRHTLGAAPNSTREDYERSADTMWVKSSADGKHMLLIADHLNPRPEYIRDETSASGWRPFLKGEAAQFRGDIIGDHYYAVTSDGAPCGRLVSIPLATPKDRSTWKELLPGSSDVLGTLLTIDGCLVLVDLVETWSRLRVFDTEGRPKGEVALPGRGSLSAAQFAIFSMMDMIWKGADGDVLFPFSSPLQSPALYKVNVRTLAVTALTQPLFRLEGQIRSHSATSADGARVPYQVIAHAGVDLSRPQPTAMYGYGGFQAALIPGWSGAWLGAWLKAGGVLVLMHLRGGGELGPDMWHQGRLKLKQNSFNDVFAIGEDVIARGISSAGKLGVVGGSNGGVMASAVAVQRPDLFRASIAQVPITDPLARARDAICMASTLDYGDPNDAEMSEVLHAWSPYHNVKDGTAYPALLLDAGKQDLRCPPWHVRKQAARMQPANAGPHPILMRVRDGVGHGAADLAGQRAQGADWLAFFIDQLGLAP
ncbi:prolyl oligopeptidase family serine peptidase [Solimonas sp. SE-A11]|uniref:prolyl oligopeptidase family serine peptidase n=1 Tax=Solimonas sp. SE-A11 TaxID=3054954 RepID=UPI00259CD0D2|nr:prolyl oligopeptidase family serine peptidase [Solimonas sp. SE-A11]MDM4769854.1 prolyl oligopeptidase family serine peptidase [Solimonas sp. SE-A11]